MTADHLMQLTQLGQSIWYDYIRRDLYQGPALRRLIDEDGVRGMTSNPTIFERAIAETDLYDQDIRRPLPVGFNRGNGRAPEDEECAALVRWRDLVRRKAMCDKFKVGDHVGWNSEAGRVSGTIRRKITMPITFKGYTVRASKETPQYLIESDKTDHLAMHKGSALRRLSRPIAMLAVSKRPRGRRRSEP